MLRILSESYDIKARLVEKFADLLAQDIYWFGSESEQWLSSCALSISRGQLL